MMVDCADILDRGNWYTLAPRGLLELNIYLQQTYNDLGATPSDEDEDNEDGRPAGEKRIKDCFACKELLTVGQRCEKLTCPVRMHDPCAAQYFRVHKDKKCPECQKAWTGKEPVGEAAAGKLKKRIGQKRPTVATPSAATPPARKRMVTQEDNEDEEMEEEEQEEGPERREEEEEEEEEDDE
jgi:hypothetical protein